MKQGAGSAVALFAIVLAVTGGLGWLLYSVGDDAEPPPPGPAASAKPHHNDRVRHEPPAPDPADEGGPVPPHLRAKPIPPEGAPRIPIAGHDDLKLRDWKDVAAALDDMRAVSREMMEKGPPKPDDAARHEAMQRRLQHFMGAVVEPPRGIDPAKGFTPPQHPAFAVNLIASVLERASLPLTDAQMHRLADLATERGPQADAAEAEMKKEDAGEWFLRRVAARATLADEFYSEAYAVLTPAQAEVVAPSDLRGRLKLDFVSSAGAWGRIARPLLFSDEKKLVELLTAGLVSQFSVPERADEVRPIVEAWVHEGSFDAADALDVKGFTRLSHVPPAVPRTIDLFTRVLDVLKLPDEAVAIARANNQAYIPLRQ
jgi:hypothetical protein